MKKPPWKIFFFLHCLLHHVRLVETAIYNFVLTSLAINAAPQVSRQPVTYIAIYKLNCNLHREKK